ncbi:MAG: DNA repair exonuclease [Thermoclostridium sp.]|nr:DNA repair exonuclease [Thermoclostridium sp.]
MKNKVSLVHCADIHLDAPFAGLGSAGLSSLRRRDLRETFEKVISAAISKNTDYLVISGDLYEHHYVACSTIHWLNEQFKRLEGRQVILVAGNHDPYVANSWYRSFSWNTNVHILTTDCPEYFHEVNSVYFYGVGFDTFRQESLPVMKPPSVHPERINIALFHGTLDLAFTQSPYNPTDLNTLLGLGMDYYALGHFHGKKDTHQARGIVNAGSPEPLGFDEPGEHGAYWVSLEKENGRILREIQFIQLQKRFYRELQLDISGCSSQIQLLQRLAQVDWERLTDDIVRVQFTGSLPQGVQVDLETAREFLGQKCFHAELIDLTKPAYDLELLAADNNIAGVFIRLMKDKLTKADDEEKPMLKKALKLGLDALLRGEVEL